MPEQKQKVTVATLWLDGCSGCHMSLLDMDEIWLSLAERISVVYSPLVDNKIYPDRVDVAIVEGAVSSVDDLEKIKKVRAHTGTLVALGDCAVLGNISMMRNPFKTVDVLNKGFVETADVQGQIPTEEIPQLLPYVVPIRQIVPVDVFVQGCPPSADTIHYVITELLEGRQPVLTGRMRPGA